MTADSQLTSPEMSDPRFIHTSVSETFPTLIWVADLEPAFSEPLNQAVMAKIDEFTGPRTQSHTAETFQTHHTLHTLTELQPLCVAVHKVARGALRQLAIDYEEIVITGMWANVNPPGAKHSVHAHPNNYLSGVYYVQADANANVIRFHDPRGQMDAILPPRKQNNVYNTNLLEMEAKPGRIVVFPAWLRHDVPNNLSARERISVSFDMMFPRFAETMSAPLWTGSTAEHRGKRPNYRLRRD